jgi:hypothetical protein
MTIIKALFISVILFSALVGAANAQTKSLIGKVIDYNCTMRGWCGITVKSGNKQYSILLESGAFAPTEQRSDGSFPRAPSVPKSVGNVTKVGGFVQVFYTRLTLGGEYSDLQATKIVEIKKSRKQK